MFRSGIMFFALVVFLTGCSANKPKTITSHENIKINLEQKAWKMAYADAPERKDNFNYSIKYIPKAQTPENCTEMVSIVTFPGLENKITLEKLLQKFKFTFGRRYFKSKLNILEKNNKEALIEKIVDKEPNVMPSYELVRFIVGHEAIYQVVYIRRDINISTITRQKWINKLKSAKLSNN